MFENISGFLYLELSGVMYGAMNNVFDSTGENTTMSGARSVNTWNDMSSDEFLYTATPPRLAFDTGGDLPIISKFSGVFTLFIK
jgi:hypothetical protein